MVGQIYVADLCGKYGGKNSKSKSTTNRTKIWAPLPYPADPSKLGGWWVDFIENTAFEKCHSFPRIATHFWTSLYDDICSHI